MDNWIERIVDQDYLKDNLTFVSLFIAVYESMTDYVVSNVQFFLCHYCIKDGKETYKQTSDYKTRIVNRVVDDKGNKDKTKASFLWLVDYSAISQDDYNIFLCAKEIRNKYAHSLFDHLLSGVSEDDASCFLKMVSLYRKITNWWFVNFDAEIDGDLIPENAEVSEGISFMNILIDLIIDVLYNGKSEEYKETVKQAINGGEP